MMGDPSGMISSNFNFVINRCNNETEKLKDQGVVCKQPDEINNYIQGLNLNIWQLFSDIDYKNMTAERPVFRFQDIVYSGIGSPTVSD